MQRHLRTSVSRSAAALRRSVHHAARPAPRPPIVESWYGITFHFLSHHFLHSGNKFVVRGCHPKLTGTVAHVDLSRGTYCQYDNSFRRPDSYGNFRDTRVLVEFCNGIACNTRWQYPAPDEINGQQCIGGNQYNGYNGYNGNNGNNNNNYYNGSASKEQYLLEVQCRIRYFPLSVRCGSQLLRVFLAKRRLLCGTMHRQKLLLQKYSSIRKWERLNIISNNFM